MSPDHPPLRLIDTLAAPAPTAAPRSPLAIPFVDPETAERARLRRQAVERARDLVATTEALRFKEAVDAAWNNGLAQGGYDAERAGYRRGTHWGIFIGATVTLLVVAIATVLGAAAIGLMHP